MAGCDCHGGTYACDKCIAPKDDLLSEYPLRTVKDLFEDYKKFLSGATAKECHNITNLPLIAKETHPDIHLVYLLFKSPPGELHLLLSFNTLYDHMVRMFGDKTFYQLWPKKALATAKPYHGK